MGTRTKALDALQPVPELGEYPLAAEPSRGGDHVMLKPVPDGTRELRYTAKDGASFEWACPQCGQTFTSADSDALEDRAWDHLERVHHDESVLVRIKRVSAKDSYADESLKRLRSVPLRVSVKDGVTIAKLAIAYRVSKQAEVAALKAGSSTEEASAARERVYQETLTRLRNEAPAKDHATLLPVPDGTRELRYTARDEKVDMEALLRWLDIDRGSWELFPDKRKLYFLREYQKHLWRLAHPKKPAKDSLSTPMAAFAALLAILAWFHRDRGTVAPQDYDLTTYRPEKRNW